MASNLFSRHNSLVVPELLLVSLIRNTCITGPLLSSLRVKTTHPTIFKHFLSAVLDEVTYQILRHEIIVSQSHRALYVSFGCRTCCWLWMLCVCLRVTSTWAYKPSVILKKADLWVHTQRHTRSQVRKTTNGPFCLVDVLVSNYCDQIFLMLNHWWATSFGFSRSRLKLTLVLPASVLNWAVFIVYSLTRP